MTSPFPVERQQVLARLRERILAFAASRLGRDPAEDLAQEVLLVLTQKYSHLDRLDDLLPLSLKIMRLKILSHRRKAHRRGEDRSVPVEDIQWADDRPDPEALEQRRQALERLEQALSRLGQRCRELFRLKLEGLSFAEIQSRLGAHSINTVYTWDFRCRKELLALMGGSWTPDSLT